jgi:hypothetical protein
LKDGINEGIVVGEVLGIDALRLLEFLKGFSNFAHPFVATLFERGRDDGGKELDGCAAGYGNSTKGGTGDRVSDVAFGLLRWFVLRIVSHDASGLTPAITRGRSRPSGAWVR